MAYSREVKYGFPTNTGTLATATDYDFTAKTVDIAETTSRTIKSAFVECTWRHSQGTAVDSTAVKVGVKIDAVAFNEVTNTFTVTNSGDHISGNIIEDFTSYFVTNFTGASHSVQVRFALTGYTTANISAILTIQYEASDSNTTRTKSIPIVIESSTASLTNAVTEIGLDQIPNLSTELGEASKTYKDIFFVIDANEVPANTTAFQLETQIDSETVIADGSHDQTLQSGVTSRFLFNSTVINPSTGTSATHKFKARTTQSSKMNLQGIIMWVTYTYNHSTSTTITNSIARRFKMPDPIGNTGSGDASQIVFDIYIEEPTTITMKQSGIWLTHHAGGTSAGTINVAVGAQSVRGYAHAVGSVAGHGCLTHRFDSGSAQGAALTLARGKNRFSITMYHTTNPGLGASGGIFYLVWTSGKSAQASGDGGHLHTISKISGVFNIAAGAEQVEVAAFAPSVIETNYFLQGVGYEVNVIQEGGPRHFALLMEVASGELPDMINDGWVRIGAPHWKIPSVLDVTWMRFFFDATQYFKKTNIDPNVACGIETTRKYRTFDTDDHSFSLIQSITYSAITCTVSGTVSGYAGSGTGITCTIHREDTNEAVAVVTTTSGGAYTSKWFDNTIDLYTEIEETPNNTGRSAAGPAVLD